MAWFLSSNDAMRSIAPLHRLLLGQVIERKPAPQLVGLGLG
jgi:hypothetical protein